MTLKRNWLVLMALAIGMISLVGCSSAEDADSDSEPEQEQEQEGQEEESQESSTELSTDEELVQQLEENESVEEAMVQLVDQEEEEQLVNIDINIAADQEWSEDLKSNYTETIQEAYPEKTVDVIFAKDGEMLEQITIE
ncbi:hypothetical protein D7Z54_28215 [Salibacterium salarium]|uniref:YusW-like protein n=1 Tax=Salibacterium salarium TaxID=284579 RepID=A0A428MV29_9BACI|nr:hypothetical protein [Salibacterium salarium]RSL29990.1 hypothetical protein D7Z54_28215 [Salibacterium salarium]